MTSLHEYLDEALHMIQTKAYNSSHIADWDALRRECHERIADAQTTADTYPVISDVLLRLEDGHSSLRTPQRVQEIEHPEKPIYPAPSGRRLCDDIGYLQITGVSTPSIFDAYVATVREVIAANSDPLVKGWIIDVRENRGGSVYPMIAAVGEILGEGDLGTLVSAQNTTIPWSYRSDGAYCGDILVQRVEKSRFSVDHSWLPVAVLISDKTRSAGEMLAISFIGRPNVRTFGEATIGHTNANQAWELSDGAWLIVATALEADRTGKIYHGAIIPDESVATDWDRFGTDGDLVIAAALRWLL